MIKIIKKLIEVSPRFGKNEMKAAKVIKNELKILGINFLEEPFKTSVPKNIKAKLWVDGKNVECIGSSFISGEIKSNKYLINAFEYPDKNLPYNISYSPVTDEISVVDFYEEPSVTISRKSIKKVINAKKIKGFVKVKKEIIDSENILIGNVENPNNIVIAHFDSIIGDGVLDNAGAVAMLLEMIKQNKKILEKTLVIMSGNEEIAYDDYKHKSGYGFRMFELNHKNLLVNSDQIVIVDGIGVGEPDFTQDGLDWVFQVKMLDQIRSKVYWLENDQNIVRKYFHTKADTLDNIQEIYLKKTLSLLIDHLK